MIHGQSVHIETRCGNIHREAHSILCDLAKNIPKFPGEKVVVVLEQARHGRFQAVYAALRCAQCAVWCACHELEFPIRYINPIQTRSALGLKSNATKDQVAAEVRKLYSIPPDAPEDVTDAAGIAVAFARGFVHKRRIKKI